MFTQQAVLQMPLQSITKHDLIFMFSFVVGTNRSLGAIWWEVVMASSSDGNEKEKTRS